MLFSETGGFGHFLFLWVKELNQWQNTGKMVQKDALNPTVLITKEG